MFDVAPLDGDAGGVRGSAFGFRTNIRPTTPPAYENSCQFRHFHEYIQIDIKTPGKQGQEPNEGVGEKGVGTLSQLRI
jgi:hypothetical protein